MEIANIQVGKNVVIDSTTSINNVMISDNVKISKFCSIYGSKDNILKIGTNTYIGMFTIINGFNANVEIGKHVSIAQNVNIMADSGPNASEELQTKFPIKVGPIFIGDHSWIGAGVVIMPNVSLGNFCVVAANSFVNKSFPNNCLIGGNPAKIIKIIE